MLVRTSFLALASRRILHPIWEDYLASFQGMDSIYQRTRPYSNSLLPLIYLLMEEDLSYAVRTIELPTLMLNLQQ